MDGCKICGTDDLFAACSTEGVCAVCKVRFVGGLTATRERIADIRAALGLKEGQFYKQDCGAEATKILGRK